jgi:hypothetical protein
MSTTSCDAGVSPFWSALCDEHTVIVQMLAFGGDPNRQLPRYLETMEEAGLTEVFLPSLRDDRDGRLWRAVPNRKWYSDQKGDRDGSSRSRRPSRKARELVS